MKIFWLTGLSGSGKSTIACKAKEFLEAQGRNILFLDGDEIRAGYNRKLAFSRQDIEENNRFIASLCEEKMREFDHIFVAVITPFRAIREELRKRFGRNYLEVYIKISLDEAIKRDVKGLYKKALNGEIDNFIGIAANTPYEPPDMPDLVIESGLEPVDVSVQKFIDYIELVGKNKNFKKESYL